MAAAPSAACALPPAAQTRPTAATTAPRAGKTRLRMLRDRFIAFLPWVTRQAPPLPVSEDMGWLGGRRNSPAPRRAPVFETSDQRNGRACQIRTDDPQHPMLVRYQAALMPDP